MNGFEAYLVIVFAIGVLWGVSNGVILGAIKHPLEVAPSRVLRLATERRNPMINLGVTLAAWVVVAYVIPKPIALALGETDGSAMGIGFGAEFAGWALGALIGERMWPLFFKRREDAA
jgi:hypothetical protein